VIPVRDIDVEEIEELVSEIAKEMHEALAHGDLERYAELVSEQQAATDIWLAFMTDGNQAA
jgi:hypothetical protein